MRETKEVKTDTSTLVVFDPAALAHREVEESDWWTGEEELIREEAERGLAFIDTGSDGVYELTITDEQESGGGRPLKVSTLRVPSGQILFGAGEFLPGDGPPIIKRLGAAAVERGVYALEAFAEISPPDVLGAYRVVLRRIE